MAVIGTFPTSGNNDHQWRPSAYLWAARFAAGIALLAPPLAASAKQAPPPASLCQSTGHRQLDFWVGKWDVFRPDSGTLVAHSMIEKLYNGCTIRETWMPIVGVPGGSLNTYRQKSAEWRQVWTDAGNEIHDYRGRWNGSSMNFEGHASNADEQLRRVRMTYAPTAEGDVIQTGYSWSDKDSKWNRDYQFVYRTAK